MTEHIAAAKAAVTAGITALTSVWGRTGWLAAFWIAAMLLDYITGTAVAVRAGAWSSKAAREGLWHKTGSVIAVLAAALLDLAVAHALPDQAAGAITVALLPLACAWYLITELGSIIENAGRLGAPVPEILRKAIAVLRDGADRKINK